MSKGLLRPVAEADLATILTWRNHRDVRRFMLTSHEISYEEHLAWYKSVVQDRSKAYMIYEEESIALGFVNFDNIERGAIANWGFYTSPEAPAGVGQRLGKTALDFGFTSCELHKICGQALAFNDASARFHKKLGFKQEGILRDHHFDGCKYHDMICFGLLQKERIQVEIGNGK